MNISIVTPCSRPKNLDLLKASINFPCEWHIVFDSHEIPVLIQDAVIFQEDWIYLHAVRGGVSGNLQRNYALDMITDPDTFVYFLDDDNLVYPKFYFLMSRFAALYPEFDGWVFNQECEDGFRWATQENIKVYKIDQAQYLLKRSYIDGHRFEQRYEADGLFIERLYDPNKIGHILEPLCFYNKLKWKEESQDV